MAPVFIDARPISASLLLVVALGAATPTATSDTPKGGDASIELELARARVYLQTGEPARAAELIRSLLPRRDTAELRNLLGDAEGPRGNRSQPPGGSKNGKRAGRGKGEDLGGARI